MASIRQQLLTAIQTRLQSILVSGGYSSNLGLKVFPYRTEVWPVTDLPGIQWEASATVAQDALNNADHEFNVTVVIRAVGDPLAAAIFDKIDDVQRAIGTDEHWGALKMQSTRISGEIRVEVEQADKTYTAASIPLTIFYRTSLWAS